MSSRPSNGTAKRVVAITDELRQLDIELAEHRRHTNLIDAKERRREELKTMLIEVLEKSDCAASGNHGWRNRIAWLLGAVVETARGGNKETDDEP